MPIRIAAILLVLAAALLWADVASADGPLTLEARAASSLTVSWSWNGQPASAYELAWRARGDDEAAAWRSTRKTAAQRQHTIEELDAGRPLRHPRPRAQRRRAPACRRLLASQTEGCARCGVARCFC